MSEAEDTVPEPKPKKKEKPNPIHKEFLNTFVDSLLKPTRRRMNFLYPALSKPDEGLLVLGTKPDHIVFGDPEEGLALVQIKDRDKFREIWDWLLSLGMDIHRVEAIDIGKIGSALGKAKGDKSLVKIERSSDDGCLYAEGADKSCSTYIYSLFTMSRLEIQVDMFRKALTHPDEGFEYPIDVVKDVPTVQRVVIPHEVFASTKVGTVYPTNIKLMCSRGFDSLCAEHFKDISFNGLRVWYQSGSALLYAAVIETASLTFVCARCNVFLIPM